jgi:hypothetical protein
MVQIKIISHNNITRIENKANDLLARGAKIVGFYPQPESPRYTVVLDVSPVEAKIVEEKKQIKIKRRKRELRDKSEQELNEIEEQGLEQ